MRYILEGEWSGYCPAQQKIVHREVITKSRADVIKLHTIQYTDGTLLYVTVRRATVRERIEVKLQYTSLIREAERSGESHYVIRPIKRTGESA